MLKAVRYVCSKLAWATCAVLVVGIGSWVLRVPTPAWAGGDVNHPVVGECPSAAEASAGFAELPDCRRYELVTPSQKNGALIGAALLGVIPPQISEHGTRVIAQSIQCVADPETCTAARRSEGELYAFTRSPAGWSTQALAPPPSLGTDSWWNLDPSTGVALFSTPIEAGNSNDDFGGRAEDGEWLDIGPFAELDTHFNGSQSDAGLDEEGTIITSNLSHVVYEANQSQWAFDTTVGVATLYEYTGAGNNAPFMVGVKGGYRNTEPLTACNTELGGATRGTDKQYGALSEDGRIVYFGVEGHSDGTTCGEKALSAAPPAWELYGRIDGESSSAARSSLISTPTEGTCTTVSCLANSSTAIDARDAEFEGASSDGGQVFFTDTQQLTNGATESTGSALSEGCDRIGEDGCNLYESVCERCDEMTPTEEEAHRSLIDISEGETPPLEGPQVQGIVAMASEGSHVYFVAKGKLTGSDSVAGRSPEVSEPQEGVDNLYEYSEGHLVFVTPMATSDETEWEHGNLIANVTPEGRYLVFTSHRPLTPDDTRGEGGGAQVFEYDSAAKLLRRLSVGEDGFNQDGNAGTGNAIIVGPEKVVAAGSVAVRSDPTMSDNGEFVFFESPVALTPEALNDVRVGQRFAREGVEGLAENVYEYHDGHVYLISDGRDTTSESKLLITPVQLYGSDRSGANVFFSTLDQLVPEDADTQRDYYDAHACSGEAGSEQVCSPPSAEAPRPCGEGDCAGAPSSVPGFATPSSVTLLGSGNLAAVPAVAPANPPVLTRAQKLAKALKSCRTKRDRHKRAVCEAAARKRYGPVHKAKKSGKAKSGAGKEAK